MVYVNHLIIVQPYMKDLYDQLLINKLLTYIYVCVCMCVCISMYGLYSEKELICLQMLSEVFSN